MKKLTMTQASEIAQDIWSEGNAIGIVQRGSKKGHLIGRCFVDGRPAEVLGQSAVDWESAFMVCAENNPEYRDAISSTLSKYVCPGCGYAFNSSGHAKYHVVSSEGCPGCRHYCKGQS